MEGSSFRKLIQSGDALLPLRLNSNCRRIAALYHVMSPHSLVGAFLFKPTEKVLNM